MDISDITTSDPSDLLDADELRWTRRELRALRVTSGLADLLATRPELRGVHAPADFVADAVRWCA
jgi:hypothetical protein